MSQSSYKETSLSRVGRGLLSSSLECARTISTWGLNPDDKWKRTSIDHRNAEAEAIQSIIDIVTAALALALVVGGATAVVGSKLLPSAENVDQAAEFIAKKMGR